MIARHRHLPGAPPPPPEPLVTGRATRRCVIRSGDGTVTRSVRDHPGTHALEFGVNGPFDLAEGGTGMAGTPLPHGGVCIVQQHSPFVLRRGELTRHRGILSVRGRHTRDPRCLFISPAFPLRKNVRHTLLKSSP